MSIHNSVQQLSDRLPELEWKLSLLGGVLNPSLLPRGLFHSRFEWTTQSCIDEIKADLRTMKEHAHDRTAEYLALRVGQKINVLVRICQQQLDKKTPQRQVYFGVQAISTRQQWLKSLQNDIDALSNQQQALAGSVSISKSKNNVQATLSLEKELGEADRRLTLAKETLLRAAS